MFSLRDVLLLLHAAEAFGTDRQLRPIILPVYFLKTLWAMEFEGEGVGSI